MRASKKQYRTILFDFLKKIKRTETVFDSNILHHTNILSSLCCDLIKLQDKSFLLKFDDFLVDFNLLNVDYDGFICQKRMSSILLRLKNDLDFHFKLLCKNNEYQKQIDKITERHNTVLESLSKRLQQQIKITKKTFTHETIRKCNIKNILWF